MRRHRRAVLLLAVATIVPAAAHAQACSVNWSGQCPASTSASMTIPAVIQVLITPAPPPGPATLADFEAGYGGTGGALLTVSANTSWALSISAAAPVWTATSTLPGVAARADKPAGDLLWSSDGLAFTPLDVITRQLASGSATNSFVLSLSYRALYSLLLDTPGNYEMTVLFTVTAP